MRSTARSTATSPGCDRSWGTTPGILAGSRRFEGRATCWSRMTSREPEPVLAGLPARSTASRRGDHIPAERERVLQPPGAKRPAGTAVSPLRDGVRLLVAGARPGLDSARQADHLTPRKPDR